MGGSPRAVVVTGLSGAGKSIVTHCFEDLGFRCVDNLPLELIEPLFTHIWQRPDVPWVVVVDVRAQGFTRAFPDLMTRLKVAYPEVRLVFVEATTDAIVRRFSETRRPHPYRTMALVDAVARERAELEPVRVLADEKLDTTGLTPHELRAEVASRFGSTELALPMVVRCESFGFRYGLPPTPTWSSTFASCRTRTSLPSSALCQGTTRRFPRGWRANPRWRPRSTESGT
jgi:UPF0042 nucleotide-binding protein